MPGSVAVAAPVTVLPLSLSTAFSHSRQYAVRQNTYRDGSSQVALVVASSQKRWRLSKRLSAAALVALRDFYDARKGGLEAFFYYDVFETSPKFSYDASGVATTGRYVVHFVGEFSQQMGTRGECSIELEELS